MKKKTKITVAAVVCLAMLGTGAWLIMRKPPDIADTPISANAESETKKEVTVKINTSTELPKVYEEFTDEETGETVVAEVQENAPPEVKAEKPKEKPVATGDYTNPDTSPTYTEEQTVVKENPKQTVSQTTTQSGGNNGKTYVEGFGYVDVGGSTKSVTGSSDGDINKMVGVMD